MTRPLRRFAVLLLALLVSLLLSMAAACDEFEVEGAEADYGVVRAASAQAFGESDEAQREIMDDPDLRLLAEAVFHETNRRREAEGLEPLAPLPELFRAACLHARDMVEEDFFAHENPYDPERETPADRVRLVGLEPRFVAENIAQAFLLRYESGERVYPREEEGETVFAREPGGPPIAAHTYVSFAEALLDDWLASPGHRENILAEAPTSLGAACLPREAGDELPTAYCVQLFFDAL